MNLRRTRPYRVLRVVVALLRVMPRYALLVRREQSGRPAGQEAWDRVHHRAAREIRRVALELEGAFTKGAQIGGARADILPEPFIEELSQFHDAVPPRDFATLRPVVERDLGRPLEEVFASVESEALAAASLAQVHRATLHDGSDVVIKVQYPEIRTLMPLDLGVLRRSATVIHAILGRIDIRSVVREVTRFLLLELDFEREVRSTERLREVLAALDEVVVPGVYRDLCGRNTIVLEYLEGIQVTRTADLRAAGHKLPDVARRVGALYGAMIFELGFFHGDPHPGNLLVLADGRIGLLDFGLCKELPEGFARDVAQMMVSSLIGDLPDAMEAAERLGFDTAGIEPESMRTLLLALIGDSDSDQGALDVLAESRIERIPEDFALVFRTLILLNGLSHRLAPRRRLVQGQLIQHLAAGVAAEA